MLLALNGIILYMEYNEALTKLGDPIKVSKILTALNLSVDDFNQPKRMESAERVIKFLAAHPDPQYYLRKTIGSKQVDRLDFIDEYIGMDLERQSQTMKLEELNEKLSVYDIENMEDVDMDVYNPLMEEKQEAMSTIDRLTASMDIYEK